MLEWCSLPLPQPQPGHGDVASRAGARGFCLPALLVRLSMGLPPLPLRPAAWKQQQKGELRHVVMAGG